MLPLLKDEMAIAEGNPYKINGEKQPKEHRDKKEEWTTHPYNQKLSATTPRSSDHYLGYCRALSLLYTDEFCSWPFHGSPPFCVVKFAGDYR